MPQVNNIGTRITGLTSISLRHRRSWDRFQPRPPSHSVSIRADAVPVLPDEEFLKPIIMLVQPCKVIVKKSTRIGKESAHTKSGIKNSDNKRLNEERKIPTTTTTPKKTPPQPKPQAKLPMYHRHVRLL